VIVSIDCNLIYIFRKISPLIAYNMIVRRNSTSFIAGSLRRGCPPVPPVIGIERQERFFVVPQVGSPIVVVHIPFPVPKYSRVSRRSFRQDSNRSISRTVASVLDRYGV